MTETGAAMMIEGRSLTKTFRDFWGRPRVVAVNGVDIAVRQGQVFGLLGPNGAGKSTLIKMILGHLYPTSGTLRVLGHSPQDVASKRRLGYLPERAAFYRNLSAQDVLLLFGRILDIPEQVLRSRIDQLLGMVGLSHARHRQVQEFSHGMGRRLGLAQALLNDPDLVLLDEPTAGLDPIGCHEVKQLIATLKARGKTVLMSSHLLADVQDVCDTVMIIYGGIVRECGAVGDLLARKDECQLRSPAVSDELMSEVVGLLSREVPREQIELSVPQRTLEEYFLAVVRAASASDPTTSGARMGSGVAEYLCDDVDAEKLLHSLTEPARPEPVPETELNAVEAEPDRDRLASLTEPLPDTSSGAADSAVDKRPPVDRKLLDQLTDTPSRKS